MNRAVVILSLALLVGCGMQVDYSKQVPPPPRADEAVAAVEALYGLSAGSTTVIWYGGAALNCVDKAKPWCGDGGRCWHSDNGAGCTAGESEDGVALVSDWGGDLPISEMGPDGQPVMPHELAHLRWGDAGHAGHAFAVGGDVDQATAMLVSLGM